MNPALPILAAATNGLLIGAAMVASRFALEQMPPATLALERMTLFKSGGVLLSFAGVALALGDKALVANAHAGWWGEVAVFASALCGAVCSVLYRPYVRKYPTLQVSWFAMVASVAFLALLAGNERFFDHWPRFDVAGWGAVVFVGLSSAAAYFLWLFALAHTSPTRVTVFVSVSPPTAALLGWAVLGEPLSPLFLVAVACLAGGLWLANRG